jgi:predicted nuclease of predicted toxin-antitoxin system
MNWLVDAHLPPQLCDWLRSKGEDAIHVGELENGVRLPDDVLWAFARERKGVLVTKDNDFFDRAILSEPPPQVVFITVGNCSNKMLFMTLEKNWLQIRNALLQGKALVEVSLTAARAY